MIKDLREYEDFQSIVMQVRNLREDQVDLLNRARGLVGGAEGRSNPEDGKKPDDTDDRKDEEDR